MKRLLTTAFDGALALTCGMSVLSAQAADKPVALKFSNVTSQNGKDAGIRFKEIAEKESDGTLTINLFPDNQLGDDRTVTEATIFGDIDLVVSSTSPLATMFPDFYAFDAPFLFRWQSAKTELLFSCRSRKHQLVPYFPAKPLELMRAQSKHPSGQDPKVEWFP